MEAAPTPVPSNTATHFDAQNHVSFTSRDGAALPFDGNGNMTYDVQYAYAYDAENRLCAITSSNTYKIYVYDADGNRIAKGNITPQGTPSPTAALCSPLKNNFAITQAYAIGLNGEEIENYTPGETWHNTDVYNGGSLIATYAGNYLSIPMTDWQGTRRAQLENTQSTGGLMEFLTLPYGDGFTMVGGSNFDSLLQFTGQQYNQEDGLYNFKARYYGDWVGRFLSPDWSDDPNPVPWADLENPQSLNLYAYVNNNPLSRRDPNGHGCDPDTSSTNANGDTVVTAGKCYVDLPLLSMAVGHHFVDQAITKSQGAWNSLAGQFFRRWTTGGPLKSPGVHTGYSKAARLNTQQIQSIVGKYKELSGRDMSQWTKQDIENVVQEVQSAVETQGSSSPISQRKIQP